MLGPRLLCGLMRRKCVEGSLFEGEDEEVAINTSIGECGDVIPVAFDTSPESVAGSDVRCRKGKYCHSRFSRRECSNSHRCDNSLGSASTASQCPKQVGVLGRGCSDELTVGGHHFCGEDLVSARAVGGNQGTMSASLTVTTEYTD
jgi:hypothetical protein